MSISSPLRVGVVGCGNISDAYFSGAAPYPQIKFVACADLDLDRAKAKAAQHGLSKGYTVEELMADPGIDIVLNLTVPQAHVPVNREALSRGKHAYVEKPLALDATSAAEILAHAEARNLRLGCAPDTFLGGGIQTCRKLIDEGAIGEPAGAVAFMACGGHETWHPSPEFFYKAGGGPMFDMGPYYLTALVVLLGPVEAVSGFTRITRPERSITSQPLAGKKIAVEVPTHQAGALRFASGPLANVLMSFDVLGHHLPCIEIYGTEGSLVVPDPNGFKGDVLLRQKGNQDWQNMPHTHRTDVGRGIGLADMASAILSGRPHRANGRLAAHVTEVMAAFDRASRSDRTVVIKTGCERPAALPSGLAPGELD